ncbi:hypothetical protein F2P81_022500 [Scophthalmus maximus]|uniref:Myozenin-1-like n=1 Tax=Scophthalmus maximus TaxID=52904 RepID=A0A6A4RZ73_SCOMX|nr:hypothetical protein F2P81_022500 [Scophthalmus maximus]
MFSTHTHLPLRIQCLHFVLLFPLPSAVILLADEEPDTEATELDLGTKIKTPKDVMLEELSLSGNKGSKMFRMRQQRVDKFIVTNENMVNVTERRGAWICCVRMWVLMAFSSFFQQNLENLLMCPPPVPPKPEMPKGDNSRLINALLHSFMFSVIFSVFKMLFCPSPVVEETVDEEAEKEKRRLEYIRTYVSPWERAMKGNEELRATMKASMPGPIQVHQDLPLFKSFNRTALPFGGFDKATKLLTFELPEASVATDEPEPLPSLQADIRLRPSFNRTPIGWVCGEDNSHIHMDVDNVAFDGETDDL